MKNKDLKNVDYLLRIFMFTIIGTFNYYNKFML